MAELISQQFEHSILGLGNVACGKHISYTSLEANDIETKTAHQTVFCIRYQFSYLFGSSSQSDWHSRIGYFAILPVLAPTQTDQLMVKCLSQHIGVITVVRFQCLAQRVALRFKQQPDSVIISQYFQKRTCAAIGRNNKHTHGRLDWHSHSINFLTFNICVHCFFIFLFQSFGKFMQMAVDGGYQLSA